MNLIPVESIADRLKKAMDIRNMKQVDLVNKTKIPKGSISQYVVGYAEPKHDRIYKLAVALDVNPVWLLGMDVPMEIEKGKFTTDNADALATLMGDERTMQYIKKINSLSIEKKETLFSYIDFLISSDH